MAKVKSKKIRHLVVIWHEFTTVGSNRLTFVRWRPVHTHLSMREVYQEQIDQFNDAHDIIDVTDPKNIRSVFDETAATG